MHKSTSRRVQNHRISPCLHHSQPSLVPHKQEINLFAEPGVMAFIKQYKLSCWMKSAWDSAVSEMSWVCALHVWLSPPGAVADVPPLSQCWGSSWLLDVFGFSYQQQVLMSHYSEWGNFLLHNGKCGLRFLSKIVVTHFILWLLLKADFTSWGGVAFLIWFYFFLIVLILCKVAIGA